MISEPQAVYESRLQHFWNSLNCPLTFETTSGEKIQILSPGIWNFEKGPDFLNAKIRSGSAILTGSVEIHYASMDWRRHAHHKDPLYEDLLLHIFCHDDWRESPGSPGRFQILIPDTSLAPSAEKLRAGDCSFFFNRSNLRNLENFFVDAGWERMEEKARMQMEYALKHGMDYAFLNAVFAAFGYKTNKDAFQELFRRFMKYSEAERRQYPDAILWGESTLLPDKTLKAYDDEMHEFIVNTWSRWGLLRPAQAGELKWNRSSLRPLNFPERRIAALAALLQNDALSFKNIEEHFLRLEPDAFLLYLGEIFKSGKSLWCHYVSFNTRRKTPAVLCGNSFVHELTVNAIIPSLLAFDKLRKTEHLAKIRSLWRLIPQDQDNRIIANALHKWGIADTKLSSHLKKRAATSQGIIQIYRKYCETACTDCNACILNQSLFPRKTI